MDLYQTLDLVSAKLLTFNPVSDGRGFGLLGFDTKVWQNAFARFTISLVGRNNPIMDFKEQQSFLFLQAVNEVHLPGPIVQWIEFQIPVLTIWVRIPIGSL